MLRKTRQTREAENRKWFCSISERKAFAWLSVSLENHSSHLSVFLFDFRWTRGQFLDESKFHCKQWSPSNWNQFEFRVFWRAEKEIMVIGLQINYTTKRHCIISEWKPRNEIKKVSSVVSRPLWFRATFGSKKKSQQNGMKKKTREINCFTNVRANHETSTFL